MRNTERYDKKQNTCIEVEDDGSSLDNYNTNSADDGSADDDDSGDRDEDSEFDDSDHYIKRQLILVARNKNKIKNCGIEP